MRWMPIGLVTSEYDALTIINVYDKPHLYVKAFEFQIYKSCHYISGKYTKFHENEKHLDIKYILQYLVSTNTHICIISFQNL